MHLPKFLSFGSREPHTESKRVYLDWAAATPVLPDVVAAMRPYWSEQFGNPGAIHREGQVAKRALEAARVEVARTLGIQPSGVTFTSGGTESNALAIRGTIRARQVAGMSLSEMVILTTELEHPATAETVRALAHEGVQVRYLAVDETGRVPLQVLRDALTRQVVLVSLSYVNSEIGTIEAVSAIGRHIRQYEREEGVRIHFHVDAAQAPLWLPCQLARLSVDVLSLDAGKFCGPKGVGVLARQKHVALNSPLTGGGQEAGLRPGTEHVAGVVGCATALTWAQSQYETRAENVRVVRDYAVSQLTTYLPEAVLNGAEGDARVANNINISLPGLDTEYAVVVLDEHGIAASTKSACSSSGGGQSRVVYALTRDVARAASTLRCTLGPETTRAEIDLLVSTLTAHIATMKQLRNF